MATYREIKAWVNSKYNQTVETCWIAHVKELNGLPVRVAPNRQKGERAKPCPPEKRELIEAAFCHFGLMSESRE